MRKLLKLTSGLMVLLGALASGQITISNNYQPAEGTVIQNRNDVSIDSSFYAYMTAGTGGPMLWDFSNRTYGVGYFSTVVNRASTPDIDSFPDANLVLRSVNGTDTAWVLFQTQTGFFTRDGIVSLGTSGDDIFVYRNNAADWVFPVTYNGQWTGHHQWTIPFSAGYTEILDTIHYAVDAWGTARYNNNSVPCLRAVSLEHFVYNTYSNSDSLLMTTSTDVNGVNFVAAGFDVLVNGTKTVESSFAAYLCYASGNFVGMTTDISDEEPLPSDFSIAQNYPNPFNPRTTIEYNLPKSADVSLEVFDILGRKVETLVNTEQEAGPHVVSWDGSRYASGTYFYRIQAGDFAETKKMLLLK